MAASDRLSALRTFVEKSPNDPFPHYGLAMELQNLGQRDEAERTFAALEERHPDYVPQYLMRANLLLALERKADARACLERGMVVAQKKRDGHALGEMQSALAGLLDES